MAGKLVIRKPGPTDLTWDEENPSSYVLASERLEEMEEALERIAHRMTSRRE